MIQTAELIHALVSARFEFVIIGGVAALAHGGATPTDDFGVTAPFHTENMSRLLTAIGTHNPRFALTPDTHPVTQSADELGQFKNLYILTDPGRIDVLSMVQPLRAYERVASGAVTMMLFERSCQVISLEDLITVKAHVARPKDKQVELELRAIRARLG